MDKLNELRGDINHLIFKLRSLFSEDYNVSVNINNTGCDCTHDLCGHGHVSNMIVNNVITEKKEWKEKKEGKEKKDGKEKKEKKEGKRDSDMDKVLGMVVISSAIVAATWIFSKDGYIKLFRSGVSDKLQEIKHKNLSSILMNDNGLIKINNLQSYKEIDVAVEQCFHWLKQYRNRTKYEFFGKMGLMLSGMFLGLGLFMCMTFFMYGGYIGLLGGGCYMLWNKLDEVIKYKKLEEAEWFNTALNNLYQLSQKLTLSEDFGPSLDPSAPVIEN